MHFDLLAQQRRFAIDADNKGDEVRVRVDGREFVVNLSLGEEPGALAAYVNGKEVKVQIEEENERQILLNIEGKKLRFERSSVRERPRERSGKGKTIIEPNALLSPLPGKIVSIEVKPGAKVKAGDPLVTIESMKMESIIRSGSRATVRDIIVKVGEAVERGQALMRFSKEDE